MNKALGIIKRFVAALMAAVILSFTVVGDYVMPPCETEAAAVVSLLMSLVESCLASLGLTMSSQSDLQNMAEGLQYGMDNSWSYKASNGLEVFSTIKDFINDTDHKLTKQKVDAVSEAMYNFSVKKISSSADVLPNATDFPYDAAPVPKKNNVSTDVTIPLVTTSVLTSDVITYGFKASQINDDFIERTSVSPFVSSIFCNDGTIYWSCSSDVAKTYTAFFGYVYAETEGYFYPFDCYGKLIQGVSSSTKFYGAGSLVYNNSSDSYKGSGYNNSLYYSHPSGKYFSIIPYDICGTYNKMLRARLYIKPGTPVYYSLDALKEAGKIYTYGYNPKSMVYGLSSAAAMGLFQKVDDDTYKLKSETPSLTQAVQSAVETAKENNSEITEEQLNEMVAQVIASNNQMKDEIKDDISEQTSVISGLLSEIKSIVNGNSVKVSSLADQLAGVSAQVTSVQDTVSNFSTDGSSALKESVDDIASQFTVIEGTGGSSGDNNDENEEPKIWGAGAYTSIKLLQPLLEFLGSPLEIITHSLRQIWTQIKAVPGNIDSALQKWVLPALNSQLSKLQNIYDVVDGGLKALPASISEAIGKLEVEVPEIQIPEINVPEISIPEPINYTSALSRITELLENLFVIDTAAISDAASGFDTVWNEKLPFGNKLYAILGGFSFSSNYNYPVIKIETPEILKLFYKDDYIILCDFENYKQQCLWVRNLVRCLLWFSFGLSVFNHLRTNFHVG